MQYRIMHLVAHVSDLVPGIVHAMFQCGHHVVQRMVVRMHLRGMGNVGVGHRSTSRAVAVNAYVVFPSQYLWLVDFASHKEIVGIISG
ncbi:hypothetical protein [Terriglobus sp. ADX1]|uniref:hypothetical protein n=1 Tax=Terriglobus sp. ADX1 TaxID=2794063 RepID=UPI002FE5E348